MGRHLRLLLPTSLLLLAGSASALQQPDGTTIPAGNNLRDFLDAEGESIDPVAQAAITPETFDPTCSLTFSVIGRGAGQRNSFGWYNVTGARPANDDLHEFLTCDDDPGTVKVLDIRSDPAYRGGRIGFFMASTQGADGNCVDFRNDGPDPDTLGFLYFSERVYNDDNTGPDSFIHLVTLDSGVFPRAFYFGWEDLFGGGDNDFEDILTRVEGITCAGGGGACDTGSPGICAAGVEQCRNGSLTCVPSSGQRTEVCNGLDDDCNGLVDDGGDQELGLCGGGQVCDAGTCVDACLGGEFDCLGNKVCNARGFCVEGSCLDVTCPAGQLCQGGVCEAPCDGVTCPLGQLCRVGVCVSACEGVTCDAGQVCEDGVCKDACGCIPCPDGKSCAGDGRCVDTGCEDATCDAGFVCRAGSCVDACTGAVCPDGQSCSGGVCVEGGGDGGGDGGGGGSGGGGNDGGGGSGNDGGASEGGANADGGAGAEDGDSGCGCTGAGGAAGLVGLGLVLAALGSRRRALVR